MRWLQRSPIEDKCTYTPLPPPCEAKAHKLQIQFNISLTSKGLIGRGEVYSVNRIVAHIRGKSTHVHLPRRHTSYQFSISLAINGLLGER